MAEAHYTTLRDGICKAYLAACVIGSKLVSISHTGTMGKVSILLTKDALLESLVGALDTSDMLATRGPHMYSEGLHVRCK